MINKRARPPQRKAILNTLEAIRRGQTRGLIVMPTGVGKTWVFTEIARLLEVPTLIILHREELINQAMDSFEKAWPGASLGVVKANRNEWDKDVVFASVQSLNEKRLQKVSKDRFGIVIADEAHHVPAAGWTRAIDYFHPGFTLGVTATPERLDGKGLAKIFGDEPVFVYELRQAIEDGYLVRINQYKVQTEVDLDQVASRAGDLAEEALAVAVNTPDRNKAIVEAYQAHGEGRRGVAFCVDVNHCNELAEAFNKARVDAIAVTGKLDSDERKIILEGFSEGRWKVATSCNLLSEGWDDPGVECVLMCRPTKSRALYIQCLGRALRLYPGKKDALVFDITDNCKKHKLVNTLKVFGSHKEHDELDTPADVLRVVDGEMYEEKARQEKIVSDIKSPVIWRLESVCPWPALPTLAGWHDHLGWHRQPASDKQLQTLSRLGVGVQQDLTKGQASCLLDQAFAYEQAYPAPATAAQEWRLRLNGMWEEGMTKRDAGVLIGQIKRDQGEE